MKNVLRLISYAGLALTVVPSFFVLRGALSVHTSFNLMIVGTLLWFGTAVFWIKSEKTEG